LASSGTSFDSTNEYLKFYYSSGKKSIENPLLSAKKQERGCLFLALPEFSGKGN
jgi:hypothetical protein